MTTTLTRLEYLTPEGWVVGHHGINLLNPERYALRLADHGKFGRATVLDPDTLKATKEVYITPGVPDDPSVLVPSDTVIPKMPDPAKMCALCDEEHPPPYDGSCLL